jgi:DNA-directed RNA polymerase specialized sigma subunit
MRDEEAVLDCVDSMRADLGRDPSIREVASQTGISFARVRCALELSGIELKHKPKGAPNKHAVNNAALKLAHCDLRDGLGRDPSCAELAAHLGRSKTWVLNTARRAAVPLGTSKRDNATRQTAQLLEAREAYRAEHGGYPTQVWLADRLGMPQHRVSYVLCAADVPSPAWRGGRRKKGVMLTRVRAIAIRALLEYAHPPDSASQALAGRAYLERLCAHKLDGDHSA